MTSRRNKANIFRENRTTSCGVLFFYFLCLQLQTVSVNLQM
ncbi:hypothetical protein D932_00213 [Enterococcus casseliflavus 14-MB-W-14]|nr:hypothetical protein D932_00213 [Enterococcus casseliflavus 14-MB-W-14]